MLAIRGAAAVARRCISSRGVSCIAGAKAGNLVRFICPNGLEHWGALTEQGSAGGARRARIVDSVLGGPWVAGDKEAEIVKVLAPLPVEPAPAIFIMGLSYRSHAEETGQQVHKFPVYAMKNPASVIGPEVPISIPSIARAKPEVDFEAELAIIIGSPVRDASPEEALGAVLGVTGANDVSARRWQGKKGGGQWSRSKSFDTFCPLGPTIAPLDGAGGAGAALAPDGPGLRVRSVVNGNVMQDGNTSDMVFSIGYIVSYLSEGTTLLPGTVILTGTPPGVGYVRKPPVWLNAGDRVDVELEGTGVLSNPVENGP